MSHRKLVLLSASCVAWAVATLTDCVGVSGAHYAEHPHATAALRLDSVDAPPGWYGLFTHPCPQTLTTSFSASGTSLPDRGRKSHDRDAGLNPYVGVACSECTNPALLRSNSMNAIIQSDERIRFSGLGSETVGWLLDDEMDMTCGPPDCDGYGRLTDIRAGLTARCARRSRAQTPHCENRGGC